MKLRFPAVSNQGQGATKPELRCLLCYRGRLRRLTSRSCKLQLSDNLEIAFHNKYRLPLKSRFPAVNTERYPDPGSIEALPADSWILNSFEKRPSNSPPFKDITCWAILKVFLKVTCSGNLCHSEHHSHKCRGRWK